MRDFFRGDVHDARGLGELPRTDLACESGREARETTEEVHEVGGGAVTVTRRVEEGGGRSTTLACGRLTAYGEEALEPLSELLSRELLSMAEVVLGRPVTPALRVLVAGLGNADMTPDAVGPKTVSRLTVTRHLKTHDGALFSALGCCELAAVSPGVMGQTGMEAGELVQCAVDLAGAELLIVVDALAARSCERLASTVQISDGGISPGAGIGNRRMAITRETMGCPVLGMGVPTVVDSSTLVWDALERAGMDARALPQGLLGVLEEGRSFIVCPGDSDRMVEMTCRLLAMALDRAFGVTGV